MIKWLNRLLGPKGAESDPRQLLADAISEIGDPSLVHKAMELHDSPEAFDAQMGQAGIEPVWLAEERSPRPGELAYEVLWALLREAGRTTTIDWAAGAVGTLDAFDELFTNAGVARFSTEHRTELMRLHEHTERGEAFMALRETLERAVEERGLEIAYRDLGQDAHYPVLLTPAAYQRWSRATFAKGVPVLP